ncbi:hypothetical protein BDZ94DRAFT_785483 [Collybia nuda]|uniref:Protein-S-isoprenylcysteine O-methyltransferase n=1 Tax=Collybia nuda TaxID=64659 RepID=A0A9P6CQ93_9AGAR|nr:hypothetical protein BDZ94DRAFT_785483 [Collybia nuda]
MSIIKIPCILVATVGLHKTFTPPNIASKGETLPEAGLRDWLLMMSRNLLGSIKFVHWVVGIAEAAIIWANNWPLAPGSNQILSKLILQGNANDICLTPLSVSGMILITLGTLLRMRCYQAMKKFFTFDVSIRKDHKLVTTGPYRIVRHPSYSGLLVVYAGMACWYGSRGSWLRESGILGTNGGVLFFGIFSVMRGTALAGLLSRMPIEDDALRKRFGDEWVEYAHRVPYSLIPWMY